MKTARCAPSRGCCPTASTPAAPRSTPCCRCSARAAPWRRKASVAWVVSRRCSAPPAPCHGKPSMPDAPSTTGARPHAKYDRLIEVAGQHPAIQTAVAHPCDAVSLESAIDAARLGLLKPLLVGPAARLQDVADRAELDIGAFEIVDSQHSHDSAAKAVELVRAGRAEALMKGSLHTDELMGAVVSRDAGIRTARRISHCFVMDGPAQPDALIISDAAVNIAPTLEDKVD